VTSQKREVNGTDGRAVVIVGMNIHGNESNCCIERNKKPSIMRTKCNKWVNGHMAKLF